MKGRVMGEKTGERKERRRTQEGEEGGRKEEAGRVGKTGITMCRCSS